MDKIFKTTDEQIEKLRSRGLIINGGRAKRIIEMENYYNLINGYKELFIDKENSGQDEKYVEGTDFFEIYSLYLFDRELRIIFLRYILEIENNVKSILSHEFSRNYGHDNYLKIMNFDTSLKPYETHKTKAQKIGEITELITNLQKEISRQLSKNNPMISHNMLTYGYVPLWVLVNTLTLGTISTFFSYMFQKDQNQVGKKFGLKPDELISILYILSLYRNACAHDERLYNLKSVNKKGRPNMIKTSFIHDRLRIPKDSGGNYICGKNDLFAVVIVLKQMLPKTSFNKFFYSVKNEINKLAKQINTIQIESVLGRMGFPGNYIEIKNI